MERTALLLSLGHLITEVPWYFLACAPFLDGLRIKRRSLRILAAAIIIARAASDVILVFAAQDWASLVPIQYIIYFGVLAASLLFAFRVSPARLIYVYLMVHSVSTFINFTVAHALMMLFPEADVGLSTFPPYSITVIIIVALCYPFLLRFFRGRLKQAIELLDTKTVRLLCIPPVLFAILALVYASAVDFTAEHRLLYMAMYTMIGLSGIVTYYLNLRMVLDSGRQIRVEAELENQLALQMQSYESLTQNIETARRLRHDLRHHMNIIRDYARRQDNEGLLRYLDEITESTADDIPSYCENRVVSVLLKHYLSKAKAAGARLDVKVSVSADNGLSSADLCVVFGNLLENACDSVCAYRSGEAFIRIRCDSGEGDLALVIENSTDSGGKRGSGIGQSSVRAVARKYGGSVSFSEAAAVYTSSIILPYPRKSNETVQ